MNPELTNTRKWIILLITSVSTFMATLDGSIVNIALPIISNQLNVTISAVQWVVTSYLLTISILLLVFGRLSDIHGKKWIFSSGFVVFAVGSLLCSFSHTLVMLVVSRVVQAVGAAAMMALSQGIVTGIFPPNERGRALGFVGTMVALGSLVGPSLGGVLVHLYGWPSIFLINVPIGIVGCLLSFVIIPDTAERLENKTFDFFGTACFSLFVLVLFLGLLLVQQGSLAPVYIVPTLVLSAALLFLLIVLERKSGSALINLELFRIHEFSFGLMAAYLAFIAINSTLLFMPFYLQDLLKFSALKAGLVISVYPVTTAIVAPLSGWMSDKITYKPLTVAGMVLSTVSLILLSTIRSGTPLPLLIIYLILLGAGVAVFQSPNNSSIMGSVPRLQLGSAGGINALFRNLGMVSGTTFSVLIFSFAAKLNINTLSGDSVNASSFLYGLHLIFLFDGACCLAAMALSLTRAVRVTRAQSKADAVDEGK